MRPITAVSCLLAGLALTTGLASAQSTRFTTRDMADGLIITDTQTGRITHCRNDATASLICTLVPDERRALETEIDRLRGENDRLRLAQKPSSDPAFRLPSDQDVDRALTFMERFMRRFMEVVRPGEPQERRI